MAKRQAKHPPTCFLLVPLGFFLRPFAPQFLRLFAGDKLTLKELIDSYRVYSVENPYKSLKPTKKKTFYLKESRWFLKNLILIYSKFVYNGVFSD